MLYNCHTSFSLRYGTLSVEALLDLAEEQGHDTIALTDINNTSAGLEFAMKAREKGIRPILGIEFRVNNQLFYIGLAQNIKGWQYLCEFLSDALASAARGIPAPDTEGKYDTALPAGSRNFELPRFAPELPHTFFIYPFHRAPNPDQFRPWEYVGIRPNELNRLFASPLRHCPDRLLTFLPVTFRDKVGFNTHRLLRAIDRNTLLSKIPGTDTAATDEYMYATHEILNFYERHSHLVTNTLRLMEQCRFEMSFEKPKNKLHFTDGQYDDRLLLEKLTWDGVRYRYGKASRGIQERVQKELEIIDQMGFAAYFLITWDFVRYGQGRGFFHVGRGSGANSIVAYCMGITDVDPIELNLYFERFLNPHRTSPPDFDIDFSWKDRDDVIDYVFKRYGHKYTSLMATYNTFKDRSIVRELGKVFGLPKAEIDALVAQRRSPTLDDKIVRLIYRYGKEISGLPNHLGIHPGGILISEAPIRSYAATEIPPKGFPTVQFDMFVAEDAGLYKYDVLSQRGLGHIKDSYETVFLNQQKTIDVHRVQAFKKDPKIAELLQKGETIGCFYVESPAMRQLLRKLQCKDYLTLVAASSVIRPGVARSGMMRQFIERHRMAWGQSDAEASIHEDMGTVDRAKVVEQMGLEQGWFMHPKMAEVLGETYGVMVYQEDVIKVAHHFGGIDLANADVLRRAMSGKYRSRNHFDLLRDEFFANCKDLGYPEATSGEVWRQMESFSGYSFCKAHSASFAVESYQSLFFKAHFPREFMVGVINNFGGFYRTEVYLHEARRAGAKIEAPCINEGAYLTTIQGETIWLGLVHVQGLEKKIAVQIEVERRESAFRNVDDLIRRVPMGLESLSLLIRVGALRFTQKTRKTLLWEANLRFSKEVVRKQKAALFASSARTWELPQLPDHPLEDAYDELELLGFILPKKRPDLRPPIFGLLKSPLRKDEIYARDFHRFIGQRVSISGYLICTKYVRTVKGDAMGFSDFIDAKGDFFDVVMFPEAYQKYRPSGPSIYRMTGKLVDDFGVVTLEVQDMVRLSYKGDPRRD